MRHGFSLIAAGFGSFSIFGGLTIGESQVTELPKIFALVLNVIGEWVILLAIDPDRKMTSWIDADEFESGAVPRLLTETRPRYLATGAAIIGVISFVALRWLPSTLRSQAVYLVMAWKGRTGLKDAELIR